MRSHPDNILSGSNNKICRVHSAGSTRRLSPVTEHIPAPGRFSGPCVRYPHARQVPKHAPRAPPPSPKGAQPGALWLCARGNPGRLSGGARGCPWGWPGRQWGGWASSLSPPPHPNFSEAGSCQDPRCGPKEVQGQSALSMLVRACQELAAPCTDLLLVYGGPPHGRCGLGSGGLGSALCGLNTIASTSLVPLRPIRKMG